MVFGHVELGVPERHSSLVLYLDVRRSSEAVEVIWAKVCRMGRVLAQGQDPEEYQQLRNRRRKKNLRRNQAGIVRELFIKMGLVQCFRNQRYKKC